MDHHHHDQDDETFGIALGFRIIESGGKLFLAEAEIAPYVDAPDELGVTLVFHPLDGINPVEVDDEVEWPSWPIDIDDDLSRDSSQSMDQQFTAVARQLQSMPDGKLHDYLRQAQEEASEQS